MLQPSRWTRSGSSIRHRPWGPWGPRGPRGLRGLWGHGPIVMAADKNDNDGTAIPKAIVVSDDRKDRPPNAFGVPDGRGRPLMPARPTLAATDDAKDHALVLSRPMIARDLDQAAKGQLVYVGRDAAVHGK